MTAKTEHKEIFGFRSFDLKAAEIVEKKRAEHPHKWRKQLTVPTLLRGNNGSTEEENTMNVQVVDPAQLLTMVIHTEDDKHLLIIDT